LSDVRTVLFWTAEQRDVRFGTALDGIELVGTELTDSADEAVLSCLHELVPTGMSVFSDEHSRPARGSPIEEQLDIVPVIGKFEGVSQGVDHGADIVGSPRQEDCIGSGALFGVSHNSYDLVSTDKDAAPIYVIGKRPCE
jgi:hypothetical protein